MKRENYLYAISGHSAEGIAWRTQGMVQCEYAEAFWLANQDSFLQLTGGRAIFGQAGKGGCKGPYLIEQVEIRLCGETETEKEKEAMSHKESKKEAPVPVPGGPAERRGKPGKAPHHEGPAGAGSVSRSKFSKESRDMEPPGEKEPGKSRGVGG